MTIIGEAPERDERGTTFMKDQMLIGDPQNIEPRDELVEILQKVADVSIQNPNGLPTAPYTLPHVQMRTHEEIEREVMMELREIDRQYGILR